VANGTSAGAAPFTHGDAFGLFDDSAVLHRRLHLLRRP
jgi:hypothetical protein